MGHVRMMAAAQPFLSGAISKTVNLPETATVEEIADVYFQGWKLGLKASRSTATTARSVSRWRTRRRRRLLLPRPRLELSREDRREGDRVPADRRLPKSRPSRTTSFSVGGAEGYMTAGSYPDDGLGEVFLKMGKQGRPWPG